MADARDWRKQVHLIGLQELYLITVIGPNLTNGLSLRRTKSESLLVTFYTFKDVDSMFFWHFCTFRNSICDQLFYVNMTGHLQNEFVFLPCKIIKMKRWNSWAGFFPLALLLFNGNNRRANIDAGGGYCVITVLWICTTWRKVANKIARKLMAGL